MMNTVINGWLGLADNRSDSYALLGSLLMGPPSEDTLIILQNLNWQEAPPVKLASALGDLCRVAGDYQPAALDTEFNKLFVGLGCGEVIPYSSWYRERKIQSLSLVLLRADLRSLGLVRHSESHESEDHAGALCETMAIISRKTSDIPYAMQSKFFHRHIDPWMMTFLNDLHSAKSADFYRKVGFFGRCFLELERKYLEPGANTRFPITKGGLQNENGIPRQPTNIY